MPSVVIPFGARVISKVTFLSATTPRQPVDPDVVELDIGEVTYGYEGGAGEIERTGVGMYEYTWTATEPGSYRRIWIGQGPSDYYVESRRDTLKVEPSRR